MVEKLLQTATDSVTRLAETALKKAWSVMEAAAEKEAPSRFLSQQAVESIQGRVRS